MAKKKKAASRRRRKSHFGSVLFTILIFALLFFIVYMIFDDPELMSSMSFMPTATPTAVPTTEPTATPEPTAVFSTATPTPTAVPTPTPTPVVLKEIDTSTLSKNVLPSSADIDVEYKIYADGVKVDTYSRTTPVSMNSGDLYTELEGITTFRGNNYRDSAAYGLLPNDASTLTASYSFNIGNIENWSGIGWTGQPAIVRWDKETIQNMNISDEKKAKDGLVEVIYAALDGNIYFFDLEDGVRTRDPISIGAPIKGSVTVDPRGLPILYVGQGIDVVNGEAVKIGMRIFSLIDQSELLFINGRDTFATRGWYASDCAPIVDAASDTVIWLSENGLLYTITLNSNYDAEAGTLTIDPVIDRYWYRSAVTTRPGMECSVSVYNHYAYFADNSGLITCLDLNTMIPVWTFDAGDDTDASIVIEQRADGMVCLYTGNEIDLSADASGIGTVYLRCLNALTGEEIWQYSLKATNQPDYGGMYATPALGTGSVDNMVFFTIARCFDETGTRRNILCALDKETGEVIWEVSTGGYAWSSPTLAYDANGRAYLFQNNANGNLKMIDASTGEIITSIDLGSNVEGSPAIFEDMLVVGTRGQKIFGIEIK